MAPTSVLAGLWGPHTQLCIRVHMDANTGSRGTLVPHPASTEHRPVLVQAVRKSVRTSDSSPRSGPITSPHSFIPLHKFTGYFPWIRPGKAPWQIQGRMRPDYAYTEHATLLIVKKVGKR